MLTFTVHPHKRNRRRRVNAGVPEQGWQEDWGGQLELWERDVSTCSARIALLQPLRHLQHG